MKRDCLFLAALVLMTVSSGVRADDDLCPAAKAITPESKGHCCYAGQAWDGVTATCTGKPECPANMTRDGYACVPADPAVTPASVPVIAPPVSAPASPPSAPAQVPGPVVTPAPEPAPARPRDSSPRKKMLTWGIASLGVGYGIAVVSAAVGSVLHASDNSKYGASCASGAAWSFAPLVGPFVTLADYPRYQVATRSSLLDCNSGLAAVTSLVLVSEVLQLAGAGLIGMSIALQGKQEQARGQITLTPGTSAGLAGLSISVTGL